MKDHPLFPPVKHHPAKAIFDKHKVPLRQVALFCDVSYNRISSNLLGYTKLSPKTEIKIAEMVAILEKGKGKK
jgi:hypothetical protein